MSSTTTAPTRGFTACDVVAPGERLVPTRREITPHRTGKRLYQPAEKLFVGEQVQAGTGFKLLGEE
ncbi:hypothetical protein PCANC_10823 [Puccinia coronata f. sp. avenae]|uniref:Uncharacterized protein n=1 Tax=Puccinia coronata f. sp. avenae TaxID=200324 RepID=A0A2N5V0W2_9BASI|nr:hypothetical protein PCANC_10823 [Puccinia coronata f. sp. avenae]